VSERTGRVLVAEDEAPQRALLETFLSRAGLAVHGVSGVAAAREALSAGGIDVVVTDFRMGDGTGLDVLSAARALDPTVGVVLVSAFGTVPMAVEAMRGGAFDVLLKPVDPDALLAVVRRALEHRALRRENDDLRARLGERATFDGVVAESAGMRAVLDVVRRVAATTATVLVTGESGTGKELVAELLHRHGRAPKAPFVAVNVAALPEGLLESELFGHARGAFTGAVRERAGRFEEAQGGTIFLDEVAEVPPAMQVRLLRVLQEREVVRVGENRASRRRPRAATACRRSSSPRRRSRGSPRCRSRGTCASSRTSSSARCSSPRRASSGRRPSRGWRRGSVPARATASRGPSGAPSRPSSGG
jgi:DNA-binding NtrC family response regulator